MWTTEPGIEYAVFFAACPYPCRLPKLPIAQNSCVMGSHVSTLYAYEGHDGTVYFTSHLTDEIDYFRIGIEEHFGVEVI